MHYPTIILFASALAALFTAPLLGSANEVNPAGRPFPPIQLTKVARSTEVIAALGQRLPEVARWYNVDEAELRQIVQRDKSILADKRGFLAYACHGLVVLGSGATGSASTTTGAPYPVEQTFFLHSRPSSTRKIYLDFNGHTTSGTNWNTSFTGGSSFATAPFDQDGAPAAFSAGEINTIQRIWQRVVEDFAAYDVDVTTEDPGLEALRRSTSTDQAFGVRVCIGGSSYDWFKRGAGGVAYVGSFNWSSDTPCYVFPAQLGNGNEKYVAEAASHEVGHTLGLNHDGQTNGTEYYAGHDNWAPIMGASYYKDVTQFSKGEYPYSNNKQDDLVVMQNYGAPRRADDVGDSILNATELAGTAFSADGVISTGLDADLFKFTTGAGPVSFSTASPSPSPNLDVQLALYDGAGNLVTYGNPAGLPGALDATLSAGTYYLAVDGVGAGSALSSYNDYGSLGGYRLSGMVQSVSGNQPPVAVIGTSTTSGAGPLTVAFSSAGSYDPNGSITGYNWDFGDASAQSTEPNPTHIYTTPGTYVASLVVFDSGGLSATATATIIVTAVHKVFVADVAMSLSRNSGGSVATAVVTIKNADGTARAGATVFGSWTGLYAGKVAATTNSAGQAGFSTKRVKKSGSFTFTVTGVTATGATYDSSANVETSASIVTP